MNRTVTELLHTPGRQAIVFGLLALITISTTAVVLGLTFRRHAAARHALLLSGLVSSLSVPIASVLFACTGAKLALPLLPADVRPEMKDAEPPPRPGTALVSADPSEAIPEITSLQSSSDSPLPATFIPSVNSSTADAAHSFRTGTPWEMWLSLGWACGSGLLLAFSLRAWSRVHAIRRSAVPLIERVSAITEAERRLTFSWRSPLPAVLLSDRIRAPAAIGLFQPAILLPARSINEIGDSELADILVHEAAHVFRRDHLVLVAQAAARCLFWPVPTIHWLNRQLEGAREEICDNYVLAQSDPARYGRTLLKVAEIARGQRPLPAAIGILRRGGLAARIAGLLEQRRNRTVRVSRMTRAAVAALFLAAGVMVSATRIVAQSRDEAPVSAIPAAAPSANESPETIVGTLLWHGQPMSDMTVRAFRGSEQLDVEYRTDEAGQFHVPREWRNTNGFLCVVAGNDQWIGWFDFFVHERADQGGQKPEDGSFTITMLSRARRLRGRLLDGAGRPLAGVSVRIDTLSHPDNLFAVHWADRMWNGGRFIPEAVTDSDGWYELQVPEECSATAGVYHPDWVHVRFPVTRDATELGGRTLAAAAKVTGCVVDVRDGKPVRGVRITAQALDVTIDGAGGTATTDAEGRYTIGGLGAGRFNLLFDECADPTLTSPAHADLNLTAGQTTAADFSLSPGRRLSGRVVESSSGAPLPNCSISYYGPARPHDGAACLITTTNARGEFTFFVPPGASYVYVSDERETDNQSSRNVDVPADRDPEPVVLKAGPDDANSRIRILVSAPAERKLTVTANGMRLDDFLAAVCNQAGLELVLDSEALSASGTSVETEITLEAVDEVIGSLLKRAFGPASIDFQIIGRTLHVSSPERIRALRGAPPERKGAAAAASAEFPTDAVALLQRLRDRDAQFDNRTIQIEQRWSERVSPRGWSEEVRRNALRLGASDPGLPANLPDDFIQPHRVRHLLTRRGAEVTMENTGDVETIIDRRFVQENKGRRNSSAAGCQMAWNPEINDLYLGDAPTVGDFFHRELWRLQWPCGYGIGRYIDSIESLHSTGDRLIVTGRMALRTSYAPDDETMGRDPFELQLDRDLIVRQASIRFHIWRYEIETTGVLESHGAPPLAERSTLRLFDAGPGRREVVMEQYEYSIVATSGRLTDEQYAERIRIDPPPETEVRDFRSDKGIGPQLKLRFN